MRPKSIIHIFSSLLHHQYLEPKKSSYSSTWNFKLWNSFESLIYNCKYSEPFLCWVDHLLRNKSIYQVPRLWVMTVLIFILRYIFCPPGIYWPSNQFKFDRCQTIFVFDALLNDAWDWAFCSAYLGIKVRSSSSHSHLESFSMFLNELIDEVPVLI